MQFANFNFKDTHVSIPAPDQETTNLIWKGASYAGIAVGVAYAVVYLYKWLQD